MSNKRIRKKRAKRIVADWAWRWSGRAAAYWRELGGMVMANSYIRGELEPGVREARLELDRLRGRTK